MIRLQVLHGDSPDNIERADSEVKPITLGRSPENVMVFSAIHVSSEHASIVWSGDHWMLFDLRSTNGTTLVRAGRRVAIDESVQRQTPLENGDVIELGPAESAVVLTVSLTEEHETSKVVATRSIDDLQPVVAEFEKRPMVLRHLYELAQKIASVTMELDETLKQIGDSVLSLLEKATHVTIALRDADSNAPTYVPVLTRVRNEENSPSAIPLTRSVFRKVVQERRAVLIADAPSEAATASLLGAKIRSALGIPLWKGDDILGIVQVDNRGTEGMFSSGDLDILSVLAIHASLAISNALLVSRLQFTEEKLKKENTYLKGSKAKKDGNRPLIGSSKCIEELRQKLAKVVNTRVSVLIEGETGVGKELIATAIHYQSNRRDKLFVAQNCAALPENLLESELFGHKKGSFTGATEDKRGLFELADGGTLFLDECTEMPLSIQSKLLRALQEGEIRALGATAAVHVNVRIVAATNRDLRKEVDEKRFREDLYYRLAVFPLRVPPLRERRDDIAILANHFLTKYQKEMGKHVGGYGQQALEFLASYDWPGNVRELENEVQRLVIQCEENEFITPDLLSPKIRQVGGIVDRIAPERGTLKEMIDQVEKYLLIESLRDHNGNKTAAAKTLGITREGLHKKLRSLGIN